MLTIKDKFDNPNLFLFCQLVSLSPNELTSILVYYNHELYHPICFHSYLQINGSSNKPVPLGRTGTAMIDQIIVSTGPYLHTTIIRILGQYFRAVVELNVQHNHF